MLAGSLTEFSLPDVFSLLAATRKTGLLHLTRDDAVGRVWILDGELAHAAADVTRAPLVARLLHGGEITEEQVEPLVGAQASDDPRQMAAALADTELPADRIAELLQDQVIDAVFDLARWTEGDFAFDAAAPTADAPTPTATIPTVPATDVLDAVDARIAEWDGIVAQLPSPASVLRPVSRPPLSAGGMVQMSAAQWEVFTLVDGIRTVSELIALTGQGQFVVAQLLAGLVADGLLAVRDDVGEQTPSQRRAHHLADVEHRVLGAIEPVAVPAPRKPPPAAARRTSAPAPAAATAAAAVDAADAADAIDAVPAPSSDDPRTAEQQSEAAASDSTDREPTGEPTPVPTTDLLSRLIDGVKGA